MALPLYTSEQLRRNVSQYVLRRDYRSLYKGVWIPRGPEPDLETCSRDLSLLYPDGVLIGPSAAAVRGVRLDPGFAPEMCLGTHRSRRPGVVFRRMDVPAEHILLHKGMRVTSVQLTMVDLARFHPRVQAVLAIERMFQQLTVPARYWSDPELMCDNVPPCWADARARRVLAEVEPRSESPWETRTRLEITGAGIEGFEVQVAVEIEGERFRIDLGHREAMVGVEDDGAHHRDGRQQAEDARRRNRLQEAGWTITTVTAAVLLGNREELLAQVRAALRAKGC